MPLAFAAVALPPSENEGFTERKQLARLGMFFASLSKMVSSNTTKMASGFIRAASLRQRPWSWRRHSGASIRASAMSSWPLLWPMLQPPAPLEQPPHRCQNDDSPATTNSRGKFGGGLCTRRQIKNPCPFRRVRKPTLVSLPVPALVPHWPMNCDWRLPTARRICLRILSNTGDTFAQLRSHSCNRASQVDRSGKSNPSNFA